MQTLLNTRYKPAHKSKPKRCAGSPLLRRPGTVFDLTLPLDQVPEVYCAMDERRAIKTLLRP
jgi:hypothetical protein